MLMGRFIRKEPLANKPAKEFSKINLEVFENHLAYKELGIGEQTRREIGKFSEEEVCPGSQIFSRSCNKASS